MKFGTYLYEPKKVEGFDFDVYRLKPETGRVGTPKSDMYNNIACFGDNVTAREHPDWISQSKLGPGKRGNNNFNLHWDILCPTVEEFREYIINYIEEIANLTNQPILLNSIHFADHGHCTCPRCIRLWKESGLNWFEWRKTIVTNFIKDIKERVKTTLIVSLLPDPANSDDRFGIDFDALTPHADAFNVVMFSQNYATAWYWESLARAFRKLIKKPVYANLYVWGPGDDPRNIPTVDQLLKVSVRTGRTGIDGIIYLTDTVDHMTEFQKAAVDRVELRDELKTYGCQPVLDLITRWEKLVK